MPADDTPEKMEQWRSVLTQAFGPIEVTRNSDDTFLGAVRTFRRMELQFNEISYRGQTLKRTAQNIAKFDQEYYTFGRPVEGPLFFEQKGKQVTVESGCLVLLNQTSPYMAATNACYHAHSISIPAKLLQQRTSHLDSFYKISAGEKSPSTQLLSSFAQHMTDGMASWSDQEGIALRDHLLDLIVMLMIDNKHVHVSAYETSVKTAHRERAIAFIKRHHCNPQLTRQEIAAFCGISMSYLYKIFQEVDVQLEQLIYSLRLDTARRLLLDASHKGHTVQQISYMAGFNQPSHFSRLFKKRYGATPSDFRSLEGRL